MRRLDTKEHSCQNKTTVNNSNIKTTASCRALSVHLKFRMFVYVLRSLSVQDELGFVGDSHDMVLHCMAQKSGGEQRNRFIINKINPGGETLIKLSTNTAINSLE